MLVRGGFRLAVPSGQRRHQAGVTQFRRARHARLRYQCGKNLADTRENPRHVRDARANGISTPTVQQLLRSLNPATGQAQGLTLRLTGKIVRPTACYPPRLHVEPRFGRGDASYPADATVTQIPARSVQDTKRSELMLAECTWQCNEQLRPLRRAQSSSQKRRLPWQVCPCASGKRDTSRTPHSNKQKLSTLHG